MVTVETFEKAIAFAINAHKGQTRKGNGRPYILHPMSVMFRIMDIKKSSNIFFLGTVAVLHDVVEDCGVTLDEIAKEFGYHVAATVEELTSDKEHEEYKANGKGAYLVHKMLKMSNYALAIKLVDRLDNVKDMESMNSVFQKKYVDETNFILEKLNKRKLTNTHKKIIKLINKEIIKVLVNNA